MLLEHRFLIVLIVLLTIAFTTQAVDRGYLVLSLDNSFIKLVGDDRDHSTIRSMRLARIGWNFSPHFYAGFYGGSGFVNVRKISEDDKFADQFLGRPGSPYITHLYPFGVDLKLIFTKESRILPYITLGFGSILWELDSLSYDYGHHTQTTLSVGAGLGYMINNNVSLELGTRYSYMLDQTRDMSGYGDIQTGAFEIIRIGLNVHLFSVADPCPDNPAPVKQAMKKDRDGDGITDDIDKCPGLAEDFDGFEDSDGCPELDNDGDGIPDSVDKCPNEAEVINDFQDTDGCPDKKPAVVFDVEKPIVLEGVTFATGSANLTASAKITLDDVVQTLRDYPEIKLAISGHTDNVGGRAANQKLSLRRAEAVVAYLVSNGIDRSRLTAVGFGPDKPVESNSTPQGRAKNRRIEFMRTDI